jgi:2-polyprenyl-6-methoxyphenol hydroxylase-like FAD-dependent oxidoreductase
MTITSDRSTGPLASRAIVIGASVAGLAAARVLSEHFAQVMVLERDELPEGPSVRKGTPQVAHAHGLLVKGRQVFDELFPGFSEALRARGAVATDTGSSYELLVSGRKLASVSTCRLGLACSRPLIEDELRRRVMAIANVQLLSRVDVIEPIFDPELQQISGVRILVRDRVEGIEGRSDGALAADLVIDCSGRGSHSPRWLRNWGYEAAEEQRVTVGVGYATAYFERTPDQLPGTTLVVSASSPDMLQPAVMIAQEPEVGDSRPRWVVTFGGFSGDHPEPTLAGIQERSLRCGSQSIAAITRNAPLIGTVARYGFPYSMRRRYERLHQFPGRYLVMGDAFASFNPIYGQGMAVAACEALALRRALAGGLKSIHRPFFAAASKIVDNPWRISVGADLAIPTVQGERTRATRFVNRYMRLLFRAAEHDAKVTMAFRSVMQMLSAPAALFSPNIVARVLWQALSNRSNGLYAPSALVSAEEAHLPRRSGGGR